MEIVCVHTSVFLCVYLFEKEEVNTFVLNEANVRNICQIKTSVFIQKIMSLKQEREGEAMFVYFLMCTSHHISLTATIWMIFYHLSFYPDKKNL